MVENYCELLLKKSIVGTAPRREPVAGLIHRHFTIYEPLRHCLQQVIRNVFKSNTTLRSHLMQPKDTVDPAKQDGLV